jgi:hypothetical protein
MRVGRISRGVLSRSQSQLNLGLSLEAQGGVPPGTMLIAPFRLLESVYWNQGEQVNGVNSTPFAQTPTSSMSKYPKRRSQERTHSTNGSRVTKQKKMHQTTVPLDPEGLYIGTVMKF